MKCIVTRKVLLSEVLNKLKLFKRDFGSFDEFSVRVLEKEDDLTLWETYLKWFELIHAYEDYEETGSIEYYVDEEVDLSILHRISSEKMSRLLDEVSRGAMSISDLARKLGRSVSNVYNDLKFLEEKGFISFWRDGKKLVPYPLIEKVTIEL